MGWDLEKFNQVCQQKKLPDSRVYQKALYWKRKKAELLAEQSKEVLDLFWQTYGGINKQKPETIEAFRNAQLKSETYIESAAQNLHSLADIVCQIINQAVLKSQFDEGEVSIKKIIGELQKDNNKKDIENALEQLRDSHEFKYISALVNTIKHRRLLDTDYHGEFGQGKSNTMGVRFLSFEYGKGGNLQKYTDTSAEKILNDYMKCIFDFIDKIGHAIDSYI
jgi:hypothetical protein